MFSVSKQMDREWPTAASMVVAIGLLGCGLGGLVWDAQRAATSAQIPVALERLLSALKDVETGQRGYLLTGNERYLEPYRSALPLIPLELDVVVERLRHDRLAARLQSMTDERLALAADAIRLRQSGRLDDALDVVRSGVGKQAMDGIRAVVAHRSAMADARAAALRDEGRLYLALAIFGAAAMFGLGVRGVRNLVRTRAALVASEERLRLLVAGIYDHAIYMLDEEGRILTWNTGAERLKGFPAEEAVGQPYGMLFSPEDRSSGVPEQLLAEARAVGWVESEGMRRRRDGSTFIAHISLRAIHDEDGRFHGYCKVARNVTDQRAAEQVLTRDRSELERMVEERTRALQDAQARLSHAQRIEALGQLAGGIAHDFNNILQTITGCAALTVECAEDPARVRRLAQTAEEASERGASITRRLLAFSRHGDLRTEVVDANLLLFKLREILMHTLGGGIEILMQVADDMPMLSADRGQLETALINFATNARDAMGGAGVLTFAVGVDEVDGRAATARYPAALEPGSYAKFSVIDTGVGIAPDALERVTEPFFTTKPVGKGTGLGLSMARGFAEQSGGGLLIESALGTGTTAMLWLPLANQDRSNQRRPVSLRRAAVERRSRLLLVDDDPLLLEVLTMQMESAGYDVLTADNGHRAIALFDAGETVDVLVTDLSMPLMDGLTCIREMHARQASLPAILMTGYAADSPEIALKGTSSSAFTLVRKPISARNLVERIDSLLKEKAAA